MAKGSNLILQNMTGRIAGIVVTKAGDGDSVIRSKPTVVRQPNTDGQQQQKSKFAVTVKIAAINKVLLRNYTKPKNSNTSPYSTFVGRNVRDATTLIGNVASLDYKKIVTVTGGGADPYQIGLAVSTPGGGPNTDEIALSWNYDANNPTHNVNDKVGIIVISDEYDIITATVSPAVITANAATFDVDWPTAGNRFVIPFYLSGDSGYGAELSQAVLIPTNATGAIIPRA